MKITPLMLGLLAAIAAGSSAPAQAAALGAPGATEGTSLVASQEKQTDDKKKTDKESKDTKKKDEKAEKVTVWILDATGSG